MSTCIKCGKETEGDWPFCPDCVKAHLEKMSYTEFVVFEDEEDE
jgi:hypothetical protein